MLHTRFKNKLREAPAHDLQLQRHKVYHVRPVTRSCLSYYQVIQHACKFEALVHFNYTPTKQTLQRIYLDHL